MKNIDFWVDFVAENSTELQKLGLVREKSVEPLMCSHCRIYKFENLKMWKIKNVFTLGPMAQATLVYIYEMWKSLQFLNHGMGQKPLATICLDNGSSF